MSDDVPFECFNKKSLCAYVSNKIINQETFSESINLRMLSTNMYLKAGIVFAYSDQTFCKQKY